MGTLETEQRSEAIVKRLQNIHEKTMTNKLIQVTKTPSPSSD